MLAVEDEIVEGVQGGRIEFELALVDEDNRAIDTSVYDQFRICIKIDSSTVLEVKQVAGTNGSIMTKIGSAETGIFKVVINPADSLTLPDKDRQDIHFEMSEAADPTNVQKVVFFDRLSISENICP